MISELKDSVALAEARKILEAAGAAMVMKLEEVLIRTKKLEEVLMRMKMLMKLKEVLMRTKKRNNYMIALTVNMRRRMQIRQIRRLRPNGMMRR
jgi:pyridoxal biosynthesis lyase PdxS